MGDVGLALLLARQAAAFILPAVPSCSVGVIRSGALWMGAAGGGDQWNEKLRKPGRQDSAGRQGSGPGGQGKTGSKSESAPFTPPPRRQLGGTKRLGSAELAEELARIPSLLGDFPTTIKAARPRQDRWLALAHRRQVQIARCSVPVPNPTATNSLPSVVFPCFDQTGAAP